VETWLPGPSLLFVPAYVTGLLAFALLTSWAWSGSGPVAKLMAIAAAACGPFIGIVLAMPAMCSIAQECL
jgi:hypothetical protein